MLSVVKQFVALNMYNLLLVLMLFVVVIVLVVVNFDMVWTLLRYAMVAVTVAFAAVVCFVFVTK